MTAPRRWPLTGTGTGDTIRRPPFHTVDTGPP